MKKGNVLSQSLSKGMKLKLKELKPEQHFTQPPAHYTEASLVKTMEELGIGRPVLMHRPSPPLSAAVMFQRSSVTFM